jgi:ATP-binding cassette subfamily B protein
MTNRRRSIFRQEAIEHYATQERKLPLLRLIAARSKRKVPVLLQMTETECGAACLAMVLSYYGRSTTVADCRPWCAEGRGGVTAYTLCEAARHFGMRASAYTLSLDELPQLQLPAVIHYRFNHFVVLEKWAGSTATIVDPALGRVTPNADEFNAAFTGVALVFEPGVDFLPYAGTPSSYWRSYLVNLLRVPGAKKALGQIGAASLLLQLFGLVTPVFTKILVDRILVIKQVSLLYALGLGGIILIFSQGLINALRSTLAIALQGRLDARVMVGFIEHMLALPYGYFQGRKSGDLLMRLTSNMTLREMLTGHTLSAMLDGALVIVYLAILFSQSFIFSLLVLGLGAAQVLLLLITSTKVYQYQQKDLAARADADSFLLEILRGIATVKASGGESQVLESWTGKLHRQLNISLDRLRFHSRIDTVAGALALLNPLLLLWVGGLMVLNGSLSLGSMLAFQALAIAFLTPLSSLVETGQQLQIAKAYLERIADVSSAQAERLSMANKPGPDLSGQIELNHVSFRYDAKAPLVVQDVTIKLQSGHKIALVGRTGAGKTTLAMLILDLFRPSEGAILYDGVSAEEVGVGELRKQFGAVLQHAFLFQGSIRHNIGLYHPELDFERIVEAAQMAAIHDEIVQMPMGYDTIVSEDGVGLVLDEATSHLDAVTEAAIDRNLRTWPNTRIVIAHRLSTIRDADLIVALDAGKVVEQGRHDELVAANGLYAQLTK